MKSRLKLVRKSGTRTSKRIKDEISYLRWNCKSFNEQIQIFIIFHRLHPKITSKTFFVFPKVICLKFVWSCRNFIVTTLDIIYIYRQKRWRKQMSINLSILSLGLPLQLKLVAMWSYWSKQSSSMWWYDHQFNHRLQSWFSLFCIQSVLH